MTDRNDLARRGAALRRELLGDAYADAADRTTYADPMMRAFLDVATETAFGAVWSRPGLDLRTRALICVISDAATGRQPELAIHLRMALRQGWTRTELTEALLHLAPYVGLPLAREAMLTARDTLAKHEETTT